MKKTRKPKYYVAQVGGNIQNVWDTNSTQQIPSVLASDSGTSSTDIYGNKFMKQDPNQQGPTAPTDITTPSPLDLATRSRKQYTIGNNPYVNAFNGLAQGITGIADYITNGKVNRQESEEYLRANQRPQDNNQGPITNAPAYTKYGGKGSKKHKASGAYSVNYQYGGEGYETLSYENDGDSDFPSDTLEMLKAGGWIKGAVNPAHKGYCTPMTKSTCTPHRKAFAMTMKKHHGFHKAQVGGNVQTPHQSAQRQINQSAAQLAAGNTPTPPVQPQGFRSVDKKQLQAQAKGNPYLTDSNKRYYWGELMNRDFPQSGGNVRQGVLDAANMNKIDPSLLYASAMEEGMSGAIDSKRSGDAGTDYVNWTNQDPSRQDKYPVDGFYNYGLDQFAGQSKDLEKKGYLPKGFSQNAFTTYKTKNEKNEQLNAPAFTSDQNALIAKSAMMRQAGDQLDTYAKKQGIKLSDKQKQFFTLANYNGGEGNMQKMLGSYQQKGYLANDKFIDDVNFKPDAYGQIYGNVQARMQSAKMLQNNGYFNNAQPAQTQGQPVANRMRAGGDLYNDVSQYEIDNNMIVAQAGGDIQKVQGLSNSNKDMANVEAERGEVYSDTQGNINQVDPNGATHEQGGEMLPQVHRVLENTSSLRNDKVSKYLKLAPEQIKSLTGLDTNKSMSHAEALIEGVNALDKQKDKITRNIALAAKGRQELDKYGENSTKLNIDQFRAMPTKEELFNRLFSHQEMTKGALGINNDGQQAKMGGKYMMKAQVGVNAYPGNTSGQKTPAGNSDAFPAGQTVAEYLKSLKDAGVDVSHVKSNSDLQRVSYEYALKNNPDAIRNMWQEGIHNAGADKAIKAGFAYAADDPKTGAKKGQFKPGVLDNSTNLQKLASLYPDNNLGTRILKLARNSKDWTDQDLPTDAIPPAQPSFSVSGKIKNNLNIKEQPISDFNQPLNWYDIASPVGTYLSAQRRLAERYNPVDIHQVNLKQLDPTAALRANQEDYNTAVNAVNMANPNDVGTQMANIANLTARKYSLNNQVMGNYDNQNAQIKNNETTYNAQAKDRQSGADQAARESFSEKVFTSKAKQQEQKLTALDGLYKTIAENAALNRNGNLIMKMTRAFDQYGNYNGYAPSFQPNPQLGVNANPATATAAPTGKYQPAGGVQALKPGTSYYNRRTGKTLKYDGTSLTEVK